jgi:hypothetical protein
MSRCVEVVRSQLKALTAGEHFKEWTESALPARSGLALINNSFLFREATRSAKSRLYLAFGVKSGVTNLDEPLVATRITRQNVDFQFVQTGSSTTLDVRPVDESVKQMVSSFGRVAFVLIGRLHDDLMFDEPIESDSRFKKLELDPQSKEAVQIAGDTIRLRDLVDEEVLWEELRNLAPDDADERLAGPLAQSLAELRESAYARLTLPSQSDPKGQTLLDGILAAFRQATADYEIALEQCQGDSRKNPDAFTNLLRIAYNFTSDAVDLVKFVVDMSDLKPLVLFLTINAQLKLALALQSLPTRRMEHKPSLKLYQETVASARSSAFHRLFPFSKAIEVDVTGLAFQARRLRLFPEYQARNKNLVDYEDRELVEAMTKFARSAEYSLAPVFWAQNFRVMEATTDLLQQVRDGLAAVHEDAQ